MTPVRARWLRMCIDANGDLNGMAYELLTQRMPLRDFLDLEELAIVERDRKLAWEVYLGKHPDLLEGIR